MSSRAHSNDEALNLERDVPTAPHDVEALRRLRYQAPSWFSLSARELQAMMLPGALECRPAMRPDARPFTLDDDRPR